MEKVMVQLLTLYGPLALGWVVACVLGWHITRSHREHRQDYRGLAKDVQHALDNNTKVLTALNVRLEERAHHD
jgi:hypothetical protein